MRLIRLGALFGSLMLLVATSVSLINKRSELFEEQNTRVSAASTAASNSIRATLLRAQAVVNVASSDSTLAEILSSFGASAAACITSAADQRCSGADLSALDGFGAASAASAGAAGVATAVVDAGSDSVLVVARADTTVILQLPLKAVVAPAVRGAIAESATEIEVVTATSNTQTDTGVARSVGNFLVVDSVIIDPLDQGSIVVTATVPNNVGLGADNPGMYVTLLGLGTVLLVLAGWTFLAERRQLERRATTDELTGLVNRREFERQSEEAIEMAGRFGTGLCIMLIDLNGFKEINDTHGHQFGDLVLKASSERLREAVRDTDLVGRWGGDEFVVLLPGLEEATAVRKSAERIGASLGSTPAAGDVTISGSVGAALYPRHGTTHGELMQAADVAMYEAKTTGVVHRLAESIPGGAALPAPTDYQGPDRRRHPSSVDELGSPSRR